ncbi:putative pa domain-containing protein [Botrytis fragariae]|uniref:Putative pa domain-containing protein n=1 Tax=Botrytis fragariae TaxID=1964551 RepID=A0A8H6AR40_9HELO|nr:putative pa domain-containing protein [Botrytis fragariae]KAF5872082.1 putative pa domain-containing protein [Botrytis fragariae]
MGRILDEKTMENNERTPLIATVIVGQPRQRYQHNTIRRFFTIAATCCLIVAVVLFLLPLSFIPRHHKHWHHDKHHGESSAITYEELQQILLDTPKAEKAREWSKYYTSGPHVAGTNLSQVTWTQERWQEFGIDSEVIAYDVYLNYPRGHRLALYEKTKNKDSKVEELKLKFEASLEEDILEEDETTGLDTRIPTFHGYSAYGNVTAPYVYVNYGTYGDFEDLVRLNVSLEGKIAIARYGGIFRGLKIKRAQELGMVGTILFSDPGDDGSNTEENGAIAYPEGPARNPSSVQRGSAQFLSVAPGDPTTIGYPSKPGVPRQPVDGKIPSIPSLPISYVDALPILKSLNGIGPAPKDLNKWWDRNLGLAYKGVEYNIGPSPDNLVLNLVNDVEYVTTPIWNLIGVINGTLSDEVIVIGNHHDAWIVGGAGDPNSGSAALNEVVRSFGVAVSKGWKPLRTIVFASWDGEEYGLIGSTEWVEEYLPWLNNANVAYVNCDVGTSGPKFSASASPLHNKALGEILGLVQSPNQTIPGQTVGDLWNGHISTMGSGSDFTAFQDYAGIPSIDLGFGPDVNHEGGEKAVFHYHSNYDSFYWMDTYGDPGFHYHEAMSKIWALYTAKMVETPVISFNATDYANALQGYISKTEAKLDSIMIGSSTEEHDEEARFRPSSIETKGDINTLKLSFKGLHNRVTALKDAAIRHDSTAAVLSEQVGQDIPWWKIVSKVKLYNQIRTVNEKYKYLERKFLYQEGLDGRSWFKHVVFAPGLWTGYAGAVFPGLVESIDAKDYENAEKWIGIIGECLENAAEWLA